MSRVGEPRLVRSIRSVISSLWLSGMDCSCSRHQLGFRGDQQNQEIKLGTKFYKANAKNRLGGFSGFYSRTRPTTFQNASNACSLNVSFWAVGASGGCPRWLPVCYRRPTFCPFSIKTSAISQHKDMHCYLTNARFRTNTASSTHSKESAR